MTLYLTPREAESIRQPARSQNVKYRTILESIQARMRPGRDDITVQPVEIAAIHAWRWLVGDERQFKALQAAIDRHANF
jgi:hypothetical protein